MDKLTKDTESLKVADPATHGPAPPMPDLMSMLPNLPPGRSMTLEETLADLNKHPLFMTELDTSEDNEELAALQALAYEGTPLENATNFKEQGNECFREKRWADAKEFYSKGIAILAAEEARRARGEKRKVKKEAVPDLTADTSSKPEDLADEPPSEADLIPVDDDPTEVHSELTLLETLYINRAACHLSLRNHRSCTLDCAAALRLNPSNIKALYRSARALLAVGKIPAADDACARGLTLDPSNKPLQALAQEIITTASAASARAAKEEERLSNDRRRATLLNAALQARNIRTRSTGRPPDMEDARVQLSPDELDPASAVVVPTLLLYPCHMESDFIKAFSERESLEQHFGYVFPLPWDKTGEYSPGSVECYVETVTGVGEGGEEGAVVEGVGGGNVEVVDELLKVFVVPRGRAEGWVREWKERKAKEGK